MSQKLVRLPCLDALGAHPAFCALHPSETSPARSTSVFIISAYAQARWPIASYVHRPLFSRRWPFLRTLPTLTLTLTTDTQITLGTPSRAHATASYLDPLPAPFTLTSERGFTTITGRYRGVPVSIVSIGMGYPNADFFVREVRECLNGDMVVVRSGPSRFPALRPSRAPHLT